MGLHRAATLRQPGDEFSSDEEQQEAAVPSLEIATASGLDGRSVVHSAPLLLRIMFRRTLDASKDIESAIKESLLTGRLSSHLLDDDTSGLVSNAMDQIDKPVVQTVRT